MILQIRIGFCNMPQTSELLSPELFHNPHHVFSFLEKTFLVTLEPKILNNKIAVIVRLNFISINMQVGQANWREGRKSDIEASEPRRAAAAAATTRGTTSAVNQHRTLATAAQFSDPGGGGVDEPC